MESFDLTSGTESERQVLLPETSHKDVTSNISSVYILCICTKRLDQESRLFIIGNDLLHNA